MLKPITKIPISYVFPNSHCLQVKSYDWVPKSNDVSTSTTVCGLRFSRAGALAVPRSDSVVVLQRDSWDVVTTLRTEKLAEKEIFTCVDWNNTDTFIMAGTSKVKDKGRF